MSYRDGPLSYQQERCWGLADRHADVVPPLALKLTGPLNQDRLRSAIAALMNRQQVLRTAFDEHDGNPRQRILDECEPDFTVEDFSAVPGDRRDLAARDFIRSAATQPFALEKPPLMRVRLLRFSDNEHLLCLMLHHIVADLWSMKILCRDLARIYDGQPGGDASLDTQYLDYARQQRAAQEKQRQSRLEYVQEWARNISRYNDVPASTKNSSRTGRVVCVDLSEVMSAGIKTLSKTHKTTIFMTLLSVFAETLRRHWNARRFLVGAMVANRPLTSLEPIVGVFATSLAFKIDLGETTSFGEKLIRIRDVCFDAYQNQPLPLWQISQITGANLDPIALRPTISFTMQSAPVNPHRMLEIDATNYFSNGATVFEGETALAPFDQAWEIWENEGRYKITVIHRLHLQASEISRMIDLFQENILSVVS